MHYNSICMRLAETVIFAEVRNLLGILGVCEFTEFAEEVRNRLTVFLFDRRKELRAVTACVSHC